jgi:hypothetical protein
MEVEMRKNRVAIEGPAERPRKDMAAEGVGSGVARVTGHLAA